MGLLDDAIREHLELKRLRGADPGEVAREQREALDPVPRDTHAAQDNSGEHAPLPSALGDGVAGEGGRGEIEGAVDAHEYEDRPGAPQPGGDSDFSNFGQETAELDMRSVLGEEEGASEADPARSRLTEEQAEAPAEDVLEETPDFLRDTPEQDRLWFEQQPPRDFDFDK